MDDLEKKRNKIEDRTSNGQYAFRVKSMLYVGDCIRELTEQFKEINKNLEKIANNTEKDNKVSIPTIQAIGNFFAEETKKIQQPNLDTIICNQNKDSYVDKNIILD